MTDSSTGKATSSSDRRAWAVAHPGGHFDQLLRQTRAHHVQLSAMADAKANMLLTVAAVVSTLAVSYLQRPPFRLAAAVLIVFSTMTVVLAVYAAMPKLSLPLRRGRGRAPERGDFNLLFFGDFLHLTQEEFERAWEEVLADPARAYQVQVREVYVMGRYLARKKYRYVRLAYFSFLTGILASSVVFVIGSFAH